MQLSDMPREKYPTNSPQYIYIYIFLILLKRMQYGKTSYARQDKT
jgi:hypothetical protein